MKINFARLEQIATLRRNFIRLYWIASSPPVKFPAPSRRRRSDREIPKAA